MDSLNYFINTINLLIDGLESVLYQDDENY
jgi:hypothetical protein